MRGGKPRRAIMAAFRAPPARPTTSVAATAAAMGQCASRQSEPSTTAARPIMEPAGRSIPPVMMTAVRARASRPTSTPRRATSNAFARERKWLPVSVNTAPSKRRTPTSASSLVAKKRRRHGSSVAGGGMEDSGSAMVLEASQGHVRGQRGQDDRALDGLLPERLRARERERGADGAEDGHAHERAAQAAAAARDRGAAHDHGRDGLELETRAHVARDGGE